MRVHQCVVIDIETNRVEREIGYEYLGPILSAKKGRDQLDHSASMSNKLGDMSKTYAEGNRKFQKEYKAQGDTAANSMLMPTEAGGLSPTVSRQLEAERRGIAKTYGDVRDVGLRTVNARGYGATPSGFNTSIINTAGRNAGESDTGAMDEAYRKQLGLGLEGLHYLQGQQEVYDPTKMISASTSAYGTGADAAFKRSQAGSLMGDIGKGIKTVASVMPKPSNG